jgi:phosphomevalonate kinase
MNRITTSAPGKIMLIGEYAVLSGAPALMMSVDRRATVSVDDLESAVGRVSAAGLFPAAEFSFGTDGRICWRDDNGRHYRLLECAVGSLTDAERKGLGTGPGVAIALGSERFYLRRRGRQAEKLGLGSSAALTVALGWALANQRRRNPLVCADRAGRLAALIEAHNRFQQNHGSGADIAASLYGGSLVFRRRGQPSATPASLPPRLLLRFVWTGQAASTMSYLGGLERWRSAHRTEYDRIMSGLGILAESAVKSARRGDAGEFLAVTREYAAGLQRLGRAAGLDIVSSVHRRIAAAARTAGMVYKPCGAGGGDFGIALTDDPERLERFQRELEFLDIECIPLRLDSAGVQTDSNRRL